MQSDRWNLARLLAPTTLDCFFQNYWEVAPLVASRPADYFLDLFSLGDLDHLFSLPGLAASEHFRLLNRNGPGDVLPFEGDDGTLEQAQIYHAFDRGSTVNVLGLHRFWPRVGAFCRALEETLHHRIYCNLFFTPPNAEELHAHYDDQDVLIIQLSGSKRWLVDQKCFPLPLRGDNADASMGDDVIEFVLHQGDVLYLPRGFVHQPTVLDCASLHLTVGITPHRWADLISSALVMRSHRSLELRRALPPGVLFDPTRHGELEDQFRYLLADCTDDFSLEDAVGHLAASSIGEMYPVATAHFEHLESRRRITSRTHIIRRPGMLCRVYNCEGQAVIQFPGNQVFGPMAIEPSLRYIATNSGSFAVDELPGLSVASKITLVRRLILEGLLAVAPSE